MSDFNNGFARPLPQTADMSVDAGLRSFMLGVYNNMVIGLAISALFALGSLLLGHLVEFTTLLFQRIPHLIG